LTSYVRGRYRNWIALGVTTASHGGRPRAEDRVDQMATRAANSQAYYIRHLVLFCRQVRIECNSTPRPRALQRPRLRLSQRNTEHVLWLYG